MQNIGIIVSLLLFYAYWKKTQQTQANTEGDKTVMDGALDDIVEFNNTPMPSTIKITPILHIDGRYCYTEIKLDPNFKSSLDDKIVIRTIGVNTFLFDELMPYMDKELKLEKGELKNGVIYHNRGDEISYFPGYLFERGSKISFKTPEVKLSRILTSDQINELKESNGKKDSNAKVNILLKWMTERESQGLDLNYEGNEHLTNGVMQQVSCKIMID